MQLLNPWVTFEHILSGFINVSLPCHFEVMLQLLTSHHSLRAGHTCSEINVQDLMRLIIYDQVFQTQGDGKEHGSGKTTGLVE